MAGSGVQEQIRTTDQVIRPAGKELVTVDGGVVGSPLLVSVSGLRDGTLLDVARFVAAMEQRGITPSLLVAPHAGKNWSLREAPAVLDWLRRRSDDGIEIVLAGFDQSVRGRGAEFASLSEHEARLRLTAATRQMRAMGFETDVFAPPKWTMSPETMNVLPELGFRVAADRNGVRDLTTGAVDPTRVLAIGEGFGGAGWWRRAVRSSVQRSLEKGRAVRISVNASKLREHKLRQDVVGIIDQAVDGGAQPVNHSSVPLGRELFEGMEQVG
ncbi:MULTISPECIES: polysaccharide deacetylase family protein [Corynebacterium]|uniref:polysaccharide deacetylase family protein n=1 Tax=Corynebacterium TaxID=1716 RepID=UPI000A9C18F7|nr:MULTISPECIES: polysaccharide deacetylase family protein [Corynebacterium]MDC7118148.1 polysaccharide deacetylase family protein [Corynebacterium amycolatum]MDK6443887.1 polysaccharide deacetylase family protein [Corynebacterium amycolatum]MDK6476744.1 polysaccharide deacetylase family protein [Corynebacterium amycolatum]MDK7316416.1 polysaccharide deacetylase family protein [Corynebacterium amycolatum]MDK8728043.1 polysaccharide deacetylase family protein [Corynebacterium amycolatum]